MPFVDSDTLRRSLGFALQQLRSADVLRRAGVVRPVRPDRAVAAALHLRSWGLTMPGAYAAAAALYPDAPALIDDAGELTFAEVDGRSQALAGGLAAAGVREEQRVGILCRNHRGIVEASAALGRLGADVLYLNTGMAAPQMRQVCRDEAIDALVLDGEFTPLIGDAMPAHRRFVAWPQGAARRITLERLIERGLPPPPHPEHQSRVTLLTSGTTGTPKGAMRPQPRTAGPAVSLLSAIPLRARETTLIACPLFHAWGAAHLGLGLVLASTLVLQRRFDAEATLAAIEQTRATALVAVPVMLRRILEVPESRRRRYDVSSLRVVAVSGSALPPEVALRFMDAFGDIVYDLYGSTEVAWATVATPADLRAAPGTVGRPPLGTVVRLYDARGHAVPVGRRGRIFVGNDMLFEGYTGGGGKDVIDGLMATGDLGRFDADGRLFVEGRDDEMIVSGGENVFPGEVEDVLHRLDGVVEAAVIGVPDEEWGQRLRAYVVRSRASLSEDDVRRHVRSQLARYKVPRDVVFVGALPRNATGKVIKRELGGDDETPRARRSARARQRAVRPARRRV